MISYLLVFFLSFSTCVGPVSAQPPISISVRVGSSALLPCDWRKVSSEQSSSESPYVEWRTISGTVLERRGEELYQSEEYEGRVDVPEDQLLKGDCSLVLKNVRAEDAGIYESYLVVKQKKKSIQSKRVYLQSVELSVDDSPENENVETAAHELEVKQRGNTGVIHSLSSIITFILLSLRLLQGL
ncbi:butyrophilin subfamily 1 member A1-like isoform X2 [Hoplias malabaricus]|uniref:butyrophilin subfamily 1 member A1-like isoform X2 n=1 Tax=Hoplias malabaricus TaxID=27720 RepID=UPI003461F526